MASGLSAGKTKGSTTSTSTTTPSVPSFVSQPWQKFSEKAGGLLDAPGPAAQGPSALQKQAFDGAGLLGSGNKPQTVTAGTATPGLLGDADLTKYMNPFTQSVVDASVGDLSHAKDKMITSGQAAATAAGAYGGSRHGVADSLIDDDYLRTLASTVSGLRSTGYDNAQRAAQFDIGNLFDADKFNTDNRLSADEFNVNAGFQGDANTRANIGLLGDLGGVERGIAQENDPVEMRRKWLESISGLLGRLPANLFTGQTTNESGTTKGTEFGAKFVWSPESGFNPSNPQ